MNGVEGRVREDVVTQRGGEVDDGVAHPHSDPRAPAGGREHAVGQVLEPEERIGGNVDGRSCEGSFDLRRRGRKTARGAGRRDRSGVRGCCTCRRIGRRCERRRRRRPGGRARVRAISAPSRSARVAANCVDVGAAECVPGGEQHVEEAVLLEPGVRIGVADGVVQPGGGLERDARAVDGGAGGREFVLVRVEPRRPRRPCGTSPRTGCRSARRGTRRDARRAEPRRRRRVRRSSGIDGVHRGEELRGRLPRPAPRSRRATAVATVDLREAVQCGPSVRRAAGQPSGSVRGATGVSVRRAGRPERRTGPTRSAYGADRCRACAGTASGSGALPGGKSAASSQRPAKRAGESLLRPPSCPGPRVARVLAGQRALAEFERAERVDHDGEFVEELGADAAFDTRPAAARARVRRGGSRSSPGRCRNPCAPRSLRRRRT